MAERTTEQIRADLAASRHALSVGIEGLVSEVHPTALKTKATDEAKRVVDDTKETVRLTANDALSFFYDERGPRWDNIGTVVLVAAGVASAVAALSGGAALIRKAVAK